MVNVGGARAKPRFVYESFARRRSRPASTISPWSKAICGGVATACHVVSSGTAGSTSVGTRPREGGGGRGGGGGWRGGARPDGGAARSTFRAAPDVRARARRPLLRGAGGSTPRAS